MKTIFYTDEKNDDFFKGKTYNGIIDQNFNYLPTNPFKKVWDFCLYYLVALPILWVVMFVFQGVRIKGKQNLKPLKKSGYVIFGNHTNPIDTYICQIGITAPKRTYIISESNTLKIPFLKHIVKSLGALPLAENISALKNFDKAISSILNKHQAIVIYPEAHIWPYFTGTRPMPLSSFKLAAKNHVPAVPLAITYKKRKLSKRPKIVAYVGNPIMYDPNLTSTQNAQVYSQQVQQFIQYKTSQNNYVFRRYIKIEH